VNDADRLTAFDAICDELATNHRSIPEQLASLRAEGKEKTVRYRELLAQKLLTNEMLSLFERHGVKLR